MRGKKTQMEGESQLLTPAGEGGADVRVGGKCASSRTCFRARGRSWTVSTQRSRRSMSVTSASDDSDATAACVGGGHGHDGVNVTVARARARVAARCERYRRRNQRLIITPHGAADRQTDGTLWSSGTLTSTTFGYRKPAVPQVCSGYGKRLDPWGSRQDSTFRYFDQHVNVNVSQNVLTWLE